MSAVDSSPGGACCPASDVTTSGRDGPESTVRASVLLAAERLGVDGADLDDLMVVFDQGACGATRARMAGLVKARLAKAQSAVVELVERTAAHAGDQPGMPQPVAKLHHDTVRRLSSVADLQAAAAVLAGASGPGVCREGCPCVAVATATPVLGNSRVPATRMALAVSALEGPAGSDIVCTLDGGLDAMSNRIDEWQDVIGRAVGRRPVAGGVALQYEHDAAIAVELTRLAAAEFACCSFFEFSLTIGSEGMVFAVTAPDEARDVVTAVFGAAGPVPVGDR